MAQANPLHRSLPFLLCFLSPATPMAPKGRPPAAKAKGRPAKAPGATREATDKDWCSTFNNPRPDELAHLWGDQVIAYLMVGYEIGEVGDPTLPMLM